jgi:diguanylate cyclase (GGDEF)-like protein
MSEHKKSIFYFLAFFLLLAAYFTYGIYSSYLLEEENAEIRVANTSFLIGEWIKGWFIATDYVLRDVVAEVPLSEIIYPTQDIEQHRLRSEYLEAKRKTLPNTILFGLFDSKCIVTHTNSIVGFDASFREFCQENRLNNSIETYISYAYISNNDRLNITQTRKLPKDTAGQFAGFAALAVDVNFFSKLLEQVTLGPHGTIAVADTKLSLLARKPAIPDALGKKVNDPIVEAFLSTQKSYITLQQQSPLDKEDRLYGIRKVQGLPFIVVVGESKRDWLNGWYEQLIRSLVMLTIGIALSVLVFRYQFELLAQKKALASLSMTDALTGISNRCSLDKTLLDESVRSDRFNHSLGLIILDIDHFKKINDTFGHQAGDKVLKEFATILISNCRVTETVGRWGGEEFLIICPETELLGLQVLAENIRAKIAAHRFPDVEKVTASFGIACRSVNELIDLAINRADQALYQAKNGGRNRVNVGMPAI